MEIGALLIAAGGALGAVVAVVHGFLTQRYLVDPLIHPLQGEAALKGPRMRLVAPLMHLSTAMWLAGGLALIWAAAKLDGAARTVACVMVGASFL